MILGFKPQFIDAIILGTKKHTIRHDDTNRWKDGINIQFATGVRTKNYNCFKEGVAQSVQKIEFIWLHNNKNELGEITPIVQIFIDGNNICYDQQKVLQLALNDGFADVKSFLEWDAWCDKDFTGKLIHWTNMKY